MNYIVFGGSGFIGTHLIKLLLETKKPKDKIYNVDLVMPGEEGVVPGIVEKVEGVEYIRADVRKNLKLDKIKTTEKDIIFNLAAVHRTPGHEDYEYFETNIRGAETVTDFARKHKISRILFTSSIAPYGSAEDKKTEDTLPTPTSPYGISKLIAEKTHQKWAAENSKRCLTILRPGIVYGKGEHGNMTRLYRSIKKHYFFYAGRKDTIKASIYVKELVQFIKFRMLDEDHPGTEIFNCTFEPAYTIEEIAEAIKTATGIKHRIPKINGKLLMGVAKVVGPIGGKKVGIHPERVRKLMVSTNISGLKMRRTGYKFRYTLLESMEDWYKDCNYKELK